METEIRRIFYNTCFGINGTGYADTYPLNIIE